MISLGNITGTVSVGLDGHDQNSVARFEVPVTTTFDRETSTATLEGAPDGPVRAAMAEALRGAADRLLEGIPTATVIELDAPPTEHSHTATCDVCGSQLVSNRPMTLKHADDGTHIASPTQS